MKQNLISGIQPSGNLTIGNYIGAVKYFLQLQEEYNSYYMVVDQHAITVRQDPMELRNKTYDLLALYIACGLNPEKSTLFVQSHVPGHAQLGWILNCIAGMGELERMTQFKDKAQKQEGNVTVGLFDYPVLMAADILLYNIALVPTGDDQKQHLELTRDLAERFNKRFGDTFLVPTPFIPPVGARIMSLQDPSKKMSKSDDLAANYIAMLDTPDDVRKKIKRAVTDTEGIVAYDTTRPGICNLVTIYHALSGLSIEDITQRYEGKGYGTFKEELGELIVNFLQPIQEKYHALRNNTDHLDTILKKGATVAAQQAQKKIQEVYDKIGFILPT